MPPPLQQPLLGTLQGLTLPSFPGPLEGYALPGKGKLGPAIPGDFRAFAFHVPTASSCLQASLQSGAGSPSCPKWP